MLKIFKRKDTLEELRKQHEEELRKRVDEVARPLDEILKDMTKFNEETRENIAAYRQRIDELKK